ncbi:hypothetical protein [Pseudomonas nitroreducens]|uniref:hypothetical protein n=1 Tax=Pseudomonas nitroreducens TaxID=46680 RepID=UPI00147C4DD4|nr:hypothetical protein [Pseudomonas nitroreducens]NNN27057.1 hypothetical protein [Pseudomonas nitroreducens]
MDITGLSFSDYLSVIGIIIGFFGIYLAVRRSRYPGSLSFVQEQSIALLTDFATKIPNLTINYKDIPIDKSVVLVSGYIVNDGNIDISPQMVTDPLTCSTPKDTKLLEFKVTSSAPSLSVKTELLAADKAKIEFNLFRRDESFSFQALILLEDSDKTLKASIVAEKIKWNHRIEGLREVKSLQMPTPPKTGKVFNWTKRIAAALISIVYFTIGISQITGIGPLGKKPTIAHEISSSGEKETVKLVPNRDGTTTIQHYKTGESEDVNLKQYISDKNLSPTWISERDISPINTTFSILTLITAIAFTYIAFGSEYRRFRINRLIKKSKIEH